MFSATFIIMIGFGLTVILQKALDTAPNCKTLLTSHLKKAGGESLSSCKSKNQTKIGGNWFVRRQQMRKAGFGRR